MTHSRVEMRAEKAVNGIIHFKCPIRDCYFHDFFTVYATLAEAEASPAWCEGDRRGIGEQIASSGREKP